MLATWVWAIALCFDVCHDSKLAVFGVGSFGNDNFHGHIAVISVIHMSWKSAEITAHSLIDGLSPARQWKTIQSRPCSEFHTFRL
jgi:hypothetical protein